MGNICPANKGTDGSNTGYKSGSSTSNREQVYKLAIQKGGLENSNNNQYPIVGIGGGGGGSNTTGSVNLNGNANNHHMLNGMANIKSGQFYFKLVYYTDIITNQFLSLLGGFSKKIAMSIHTNVVFRLNEPIISSKGGVLMFLKLFYYRKKRIFRTNTPKNINYNGHLKKTHS